MFKGEMLWMDTILHDFETKPLLVGIGESVQDFCPIPGWTALCDLPFICFPVAVERNWANPNGLPRPNQVSSRFPALPNSKHGPPNTGLLHL